jgi:competence protein ComGC
LRNLQNGISLIEIIVCICIFSILSLTAVPNVSEIIASAKFKEVIDEFRKDLIVIRANALNLDKDIELTIDNSGCMYTFKDISGATIVKNLPLGFKFQRGKLITISRDGLIVDERNRSLITSLKLIGPSNILKEVEIGISGKIKK